MQQTCTFINKSPTLRTFDSIIHLLPTRLDAVHYEKRIIKAGTYNFSHLSQHYFFRSSLKPLFCPGHPKQIFHILSTSNIRTLDNLFRLEYWPEEKLIFINNSRKIEL